MNSVILYKVSYITNVASNVTVKANMNSVILYKVNYITNVASNVTLILLLLLFKYNLLITMGQAGRAKCLMGRAQDNLCANYCY